MQKLTLKFLISGLLFFFSSPIQAEQNLVVGIGRDITEAVPEAIINAKKALLETGLPVNFKIFPPERSLQMAGHGEIAIDILRTGIATRQFPDLIAIKPQIMNVDVWLVSLDPANCQLTQQQRENKTIVGLLGIRYYESIYPSFHNRIEAVDMEQLMASLRREAEFTTLSKGTIQDLEARYGRPLHLCDTDPFFSYPVNSYIHKDYAWAIPKIEAAYRKQFGENEKE